MLIGIILIAVLSPIFIALIYSLFIKDKTHKLNMQAINLYFETLYMDQHKIFETRAWLEVNKKYIDKKFKDTLLGYLEKRETRLDKEWNESIR